ncbi:MAG: general secretion pathway protein GspK, partial [Candidatus Omnitrophica bacterium]|nr:general secretion pathway protein GspK [Candidatus Omnitrophota bacterium]
KSAKFSNIEELRLVKGVTSEIYDLIKGLITVYPKDGEGRVNINTASKDVLEILINTSFNKLEARGVDVENPLGLLEAIITFREGDDGVFDSLDIELKLAGLISDPQKNIITDPTDGLKHKIGVQSTNYRIISEGNLGDAKLKNKINCVYSRKDKKIISWHQN